VSTQARPGPASTARRFVVARAADIPEGERLVVSVGGREVGVFHINGRFYGLLNRCPHQGGPICKGEVLGLIESDRPGQYHFDPDTKLVACPWHGWEFDLQTGQSFWDPDRTRARPIPVEVQPGSAIAPALAQQGDDPVSQRIRGPYVAQVIPVSVQDDYVVVTIGRPRPERSP
jgi:3-phenylpropionate/trans-cinnamate dioxygenase ferredoxin subunit